MPISKARRVIYPLIVVVCGAIAWPQIDKIVRQEDYRMRQDLAMWASQTGTFFYNAKTGRLYLDDRAFDLFGRDASTFDGTKQALIRWMVDDDRDRVAEIMAQCSKDRGRSSFYFRILDPNGRERFILSHCGASPDGQYAGGTFHLLGEEKTAWINRAKESIRNENANRPRTPIDVRS